MLMEIRANFEQRTTFSAKVVQEYMNIFSMEKIIQSKSLLGNYEYFTWAVRSIFPYSTRLCGDTTSLETKYYLLVCELTY